MVVEELTLSNAHSASVSPTESRHSSCSADDHSGSWRGDRFLQTLHVFGNLHYDQKATEIQTRSLLLSGPTGLWNLDVHCLCLYRSQCCTLSGKSVCGYRCVLLHHSWCGCAMCVHQYSAYKILLSFFIFVASFNLGAQRDTTALFVCVMYVCGYCKQYV